MSVCCRFLYGEEDILIFSTQRLSDTTTLPAGSFVDTENAEIKSGQVLKKRDQVAC